MENIFHFIDALRQATKCQATKLMPHLQKWDSIINDMDICVN